MISNIRISIIFNIFYSLTSDSITSTSWIIKRNLKFTKYTTIIKILLYPSNFLSRTKFSKFFNFFISYIIYIFNFKRNIIFSFNFSQFIISFKFRRQSIIFFRSNISMFTIYFLIHILFNCMSNSQRSILIITVYSLTLSFKISISSIFTKMNIHLSIFIYRIINRILNKFTLIIKVTKSIRLKFFICFRSKLNIPTIKFMSKSFKKIYKTKILCRQYSFSYYSTCSRSIF